ncbi:MAG: hypothetical protein HUU38_00090 [Anaerolineales bacterium]|nr:hypothetical protein [Anaerolineales bacterium]
MNPTPSRLARGYQLAFSVAFFIILLLPLRRLTLSPGDLEANFFGRAWLIQEFNLARVALGDRVFPKTIVGDEGWVFYRAEKSLDDYQNAIPLSETDLTEIQTNLDALASAYAARGIQLLVVIVPDKATIYGDYLPPEIPILGAESRLDQLTAYLAAHGTPLLDLRPALRAARETQQVYFKTDTHWNDYGAYVGYTEMLRALGLEPFPLDAFDVKSAGLKLLDLSRNMGTNILEERIDLLAPDDAVRYRKLPLADGRNLTLTYHEDQSLPRAVIYHDSFFFQLIPMFAPHFRQITFIPHYTGGEIWNLDWVEEEQPDIVIIEFAERYLADLARLVKPREVR